MSDERPFVFISCGQSTKEEKKLGAAIAELVTELTPFTGYFAEAESTLTGITKNVFAKLNTAEGLIAIIHPRGEILTSQGRHVRGSVWIEQEIAIVAFLAHLFRKQPKILAYVHKDVRREGLREQLHLNPTFFSSNIEILDDLQVRLRQWNPARDTIGAVVTSKVIRIRTDRVNFRLVVALKNYSSKATRDYRLDVLFPLALLNRDEFQKHEQPRGASTHSLFRISEVDHPLPIRPGEIIEVMAIDWRIDIDELKNGGLLNLPVLVEVFTGTEVNSTSWPIFELIEMSGLGRKVGAAW